jgi:hypothetical protein
MKTFTNFLIESVAYDNADVDGSSHPGSDMHTEKHYGDHNLGHQLAHAHAEELRNQLDNRGYSSSSRKNVTPHQSSETTHHLDGHSITVKTNGKGHIQVESNNAKRS